MRIMNCGREPLVCQVSARRPTVIGSEEKVWPPKHVTLPSRQVVELPDVTAQPILERWTLAGVIEVPLGADEKTLLLKGMKTRYDTLVKRIQAYRTEQMQNKAKGADIRLPNDQDRAILEEIKAIQAEMTTMDPVLSEAIPDVKPTAPAMDPVTAELASFGIQPSSVVVPGTELDDMGFTI